MAYLGFNFRATAAWVTDGTGESAVTDVDLTNYTYPYTSFGNGVTAGYVGGSNAMRSRDRNSGVDRRCAGLHFDNVTTAQQVWRVDLASTGSKNVVISIGDNSYATGDDYLELFDDTTSLGVLVNDSNGHPAGQFYDANAALHTSAANWASNQTPIAKTFASTILKIKLGRGAGSAGNPGIAHLAWDDVGGGGGGATFNSFKTLLGVGR